MAIPAFQDLTLPLLWLTVDGAEHKISDMVATLADQFQLSDEERAQLLPSGVQRTFYNHVAWAATYLRAAAVLANPVRGSYVITERGRLVLKRKPKRADIPFLLQFAEFKAWRTGTGKVAVETPTSTVSADQTPEEAFEAAYQSLRSGVEQELLDRVMNGDPTFFEQIVVQLLVAMGYGGTQADAGRAVGKSGDGGIDGIIKEDRLGLDSLYLQAKKWDGTVGRPGVQKFAGSLDGQHARRGVMITTSSFAPNARAYVQGIEKRIVLIDGQELARLMFEFGVGVTPVGTPYILKRVDPDYFEDG